MASDDDKLFADPLHQYLWVCALVGIVFIVLGMAFAYAHDSKRPELNSWFKNLHSDTGPCCSDADGALVQDADWDTKNIDGHVQYRVRIEGQWIDVPDKAVVKQPNLYGHTVVWGSRLWYSTQTYSILCFMPGVMM